MNQIMGWDGMVNPSRIVSSFCCPYDYVHALCLPSRLNALYEMLIFRQTIPIATPPR